MANIDDEADSEWVEETLHSNGHLGGTSSHEYEEFVEEDCEYEEEIIEEDEEEEEEEWVEEVDGPDDEDLTDEQLLSRLQTSFREMASKSAGKGASATIESSTTTPHSKPPFIPQKQQQQQHQQQLQEQKRPLSQIPSVHTRMHTEHRRSSIASGEYSIDDSASVDFDLGSYQEAMSFSSQESAPTDLEQSCRDLIAIVSPRKSSVDADDMIKRCDLPNLYKILKQQHKHMMRDRASNVADNISNSDSQQNWESFQEQLSPFSNESQADWVHSSSNQLAKWNEQNTEDENDDPWGFNHAPQLPTTNDIPFHNANILPISISPSILNSEIRNCPPSSNADNRISPDSSTEMEIENHPPIEKWLERYADDPDDYETACQDLIAVLYKESEDHDIATMLRRMKPQDLYRYLKNQFWYLQHTNQIGKQVTTTLGDEASPGPFEPNNPEILESSNIPPHSGDSTAAPGSDSVSIIHSSHHSDDNNIPSNGSRDDETKQEAQEVPDELLEKLDQTQMWLDNNAANLVDLEVTCRKLIRTLYESDKFDHDPDTLLRRTPIEDLFQYLSKEIWYQMHHGLMDNVDIRMIQLDKEITTEPPNHIQKLTILEEQLSAAFHKRQALRRLSSSYEDSGYQAPNVLSQNTGDTTGFSVAGETKYRELGENGTDHSDSSQSSGRLPFENQYIDSTNLPDSVRDCSDSRASASRNHSDTGSERDESSATSDQTTDEVWLERQPDAAIEATTSLLQATSAHSTILENCGKSVNHPQSSVGQNCSATSDANLVLSTEEVVHVTVGPTLKSPDSDSEYTENKNLPHALDGGYGFSTIKIGGDLSTDDAGQGHHQEPVEQSYNERTETSAALTKGENTEDSKNESKVVFNSEQVLIDTALRSRPEMQGGVEGFAGPEAIEQDIFLRGERPAVTEAAATHEENRLEEMAQILEFKRRVDKARLSDDAKALENMRKGTEMSRVDEKKRLDEERRESFADIREKARVLEEKYYFDSAKIQEKYEEIQVFRDTELARLSSRVRILEDRLKAANIAIEKEALGLEEKRLMDEAMFARKQKSLREKVRNAQIRLEIGKTEAAEATKGSLIENQEKAGGFFGVFGSKKKAPDLEKEKEKQAKLLAWKLEEIELEKVIKEAEDDLVALDEKNAILEKTRAGLLSELEEKERTLKKEFNEEKEKLEKDSIGLKERCKETETQLLETRKLLDRTHDDDKIWVATQKSEIEIRYQCGLQKLADDLRAHRRRQIDEEIRINNTAQTLKERWLREEAALAKELEQASRHKAMQEAATERLREEKESRIKAEKEINHPQMVVEKLAETEKQRVQQMRETESDGHTLVDETACLDLDAGEATTGDYFEDKASNGEEEGMGSVVHAVPNTYNKSATKFMIVQEETPLKPYEVTEAVQGEDEAIRNESTDHASFASHTCSLSDDKVASITSAPATFNREIELSLSKQEFSDKATESVRAARRIVDDETFLVLPEESVVPLPSSRHASMDKDDSEIIEDMSSASGIVLPGMEALREDVEQADKSENSPAHDSDLAKNDKFETESFKLEVPENVAAATSQSSEVNLNRAEALDSSTYVISDRDYRDTVSFPLEMTDDVALGVLGDGNTRKGVKQIASSNAMKQISTEKSLQTRCRQPVEESEAEVENGEYTQLENRDYLSIYTMAKTRSQNTNIQNGREVVKLFEISGERLQTDEVIAGVQRVESASDFSEARSVFGISDEQLQINEDVSGVPGAECVSDFSSVLEFCQDIDIAPSHVDVEARTGSNPPAAGAQPFLHNGKDGINPQFNSEEATTDSTLQIQTQAQENKGNPDSNSDEHSIQVSNEVASRLGALSSIENGNEVNISAAASISQQGDKNFPMISSNSEIDTENYSVKEICPGSHNKAKIERRHDLAGERTNCGEIMQSCMPLDQSCDRGNAEEKGLTSPSRDIGMDCENSEIHTGNEPTSLALGKDSPESESEYCDSQGTIERLNSSMDKRKEFATRRNQKTGVGLSSRLLREAQLFLETSQKSFNQTGFDSVASFDKSKENFAYNTKSSSLVAKDSFPEFKSSLEPLTFTNATLLVGGTRPRIVLLTSSTPINQLQRTSQERCSQLLQTVDIDVELVDGANPRLNEVRENLFHLCGERGKYPQVFVVDEIGTIKSFGGYEHIQSLNEQRKLHEAIRLCCAAENAVHHKSVSNFGPCTEDATYTESSSLASLATHKDTHPPPGVGNLAISTSNDCNTSQSLETDIEVAHPVEKGQKLVSNYEKELESKTTRKVSLAFHSDNPLLDRDNSVESIHLHVVHENSFNGSPLTVSKNDQSSHITVSNSKDVTSVVGTPASLVQSSKIAIDTNVAVVQTEVETGDLGKQNKTVELLEGIENTEPMGTDRFFSRPKEVKNPHSTNADMLLRARWSPNRLEWWRQNGKRLVDEKREQTPHGDMSEIEKNSVDQTRIQPPSIGHNKTTIKQEPVLRQKSKLPMPSTLEEKRRKASEARARALATRGGIRRHTNNLIAPTERAQAEEREHVGVAQSGYKGVGSGMMPSYSESSEVTSRNAAVLYSPVDLTKEARLAEAQRLAAKSSRARAARLAREAELAAGTRKVKERGELMVLDQEDFPQVETGEASGGLSHIAAASPTSDQPSLVSQMVREADRLTGFISRYERKLETVCKSLLAIAQQYEDDEGMGEARNLPLGAMYDFVSKRSWFRKYSNNETNPSFSLGNRKSGKSASALTESSLESALKVTPAGMTFLAMDGPIEADVGRFLRSFGAFEGNPTLLGVKQHWIEVARLSGDAQSHRIKEGLENMVSFCLETGFLTQIGAAGEGKTL